MFSKDKIEAVKKLFKEVEKTKEFVIKFDLKFGNNAVILRPKQEELKMLCVKTPLLGIFADIKPVEEKDELTEDEKAMLDNVLSDEGILDFSITNDIKVYEKIVKHEELKNTYRDFTFMTLMANIIL
jgi:hypothetical protein